MPRNKKQERSKQMKDSCIPAFHKLSIEERVRAIRDRGMISQKDYKNLLAGRNVLSLDNAGAMIENVVRRAKKLAIKRVIDGGSKGVCTQDLLDSIKQEYKEHEDLPNTTNPDDWARISGKKGERIVFIRTLIKGKSGDEPGRSIDTVANTGHYL